MSQVTVTVMLREGVNPLDDVDLMLKDLGYVRQSIRPYQPIITFELENIEKPSMTVVYEEKDLNRI